MLNGVFMSKIPWGFTGSRLLLGLKYPQCATHSLNNLSVISCRGFKITKNLPFLTSSVNNKHSVIKQCDNSTIDLLFKFPPENLRSQEISLLQNVSPSIVWTQMRFAHHEESTRTSRRKDKKTNQASPDDVAKRYLSSEEDTESSKKLTIFQRFKQTYKKHGKVLVAVHLVTSTVWFGMFYGAARWGVDIVPFLESMNFGESYIKPFRSGAGDIALMYLFYKLATPARYTVTIVGTNLTIKYLKKGGSIQPIPSEDTLSALYQEGKVSLKRRSALEMRKGVKNVKANIKKVNEIYRRRGKRKDKH